MTDEQKQRLEILDRLAALFFGMHDSDSSSDYREKKMAAMRLLEPLTEKREIKAPCAGKVGDLELRAGLSISSNTEDDALLLIGEEEVSAGSMGVIEKVLVKEGDTVKKGQALFVLRAYLGT
jgi:biotin carboxyl carrier protein